MVVVARCTPCVTVAESPSHPLTAQLRFSMDAAPAVISPLCSPLVARVGMLFRLSNILKQWKPALAVLTRDGYLHVFALGDTAEELGGTHGSHAHANTMATHPDLLVAILRWSSELAAGAPPPPELTQPVQPLQPPPEAGGSSGAVPLPPPALPAALAALSANLATSCPDLSTVGDLGAAARAVASEPPSAQTYVLTPSSRFDLVPTAHPHAFEVSDKAGWFGSVRLMLRAQSQQDLNEWRAATLAMVEQAVIMQPQQQ